MRDIMVDVSINIYAKPYQTALSLLSLLRWSGEHIDRIFLQFEPSGSRFDSVPPYAMADYLGDRAIIYQPEEWVECDAVDEARLGDASYRLSMRYQSAFEYTDKKYLFILHNDVLIKRDIIGAMLEKIDDAFIIGQLGQCWNCPASQAELVQAAGLGDTPCTPERYFDFRPNVEQLERLYALAREQGARCRPYWEGWQKHYTADVTANKKADMSEGAYNVALDADNSEANVCGAWPLPECRVNEWGCLVDIEQTKAHVMPHGEILPFGAFEACGSITLDTSVAWFRELSRRGLTAKHFPLDKYLRHYVGSHRVVRGAYIEAEGTAKQVLLKGYTGFVEWCKQRRNGLFD